MLHKSIRTPTEALAELLAEEDLDDTGKPHNPLGIIESAEDLFDRAATQLGWTWGQTRRHFYRMCEQLGVSPDGD